MIETHLETAPANAMYTSKTIQNELICICGNFIQNKILESIREAGFYSVIADEATDASNHEQLSITIRFVSNDCPCERFLGFHKCETGVTGEAIAENILSQLRLWQLPVSLLRGQSYDGAGAMSGQIREAASRISSKYPKAVYVHCAAHRLNLCIVKCCKIRVVSNMIDTVSSVARFFNNSPKRQLALEKWIADVQPCDEKRRKLKDLCRTRWIERHEAYEVFIDLFFPFVSCVEDIVHSSSSEWNRDTRSDAHSCLLALSQFSFICTLVVTKTILACTKGLSVKLQGRYIDVVRAHKDIEAVKSTLKEFRSNVESFHDRHYHEAFQLAALLDVEESAPRLAGRQQHRQNVPATSTAEYYRLNVTVPLLDHIISELDSRFNSESSSVVEFIQLLPCALYQKPASERLTAADLDRVLKLYEGDLPCARSMDVELGLWRAMWKDSELAEDLNTPVKALPHVDKDYFPNIRTLILIMVTIPITSCECERSFSLLLLVKSTLRTTMTEDRLNGLALMQCHQDIKLDPNEIVEEFARSHPRRMKL